MTGARQSCPAPVSSIIIMNKRLFLSLCPAFLCASTVFAQDGITAFPQESSGKIMSGATLSPFSTKINTVRDFTEEPARNTINKVGASGSTIYGYQSYADLDEFTGGLYEIEPTGDMTRLWDYSYANIGAILSNGWIRNGSLCGLGVYTLGSEDLVGDYAYQEFDLITGKMTLMRQIDVLYETLPYFHKAAYVPEDDRIYGFGRIGDIYSDNRYIFKSAPADKPEEAVMITEVSPGERCYSLCWHPVDHCFYGVNTWSKLVKIDRDGTYTELCELPLENIANSPSALVFSPYDGYLLWNPAVNAASSTLYAIYPDEKRIEKLHTFDIDRQFTFFTSPDFEVDEAAPAAATYLGADFKDAAHEGTISFRLPSKTLGGETIEGELSYTLYTNGKQAAQGNGMAGSEIAVPVTGLTDAYYTFRIEASASGKKGVPCVTHLYVGNDTPATPANVVINKTNISWDAVTEGTHKGYLDLTAIEYEVYLNDRLLGKTQSAVYEYTIDNTQELDAFVAKVVAVCNGKTSAEGVSEKAILGNPLSLPVQIIPTEHQAQLCTYINRDGSPDYGTWSLSDLWGDLCFASGWSYEQPDDWLILPITMLPDADKVYSVSLEAARGGQIGTREYFEVWAGTSPDPESMTIPVIEKTRARNYNEWVDYSGIFAIPQAGTYYIAVHGVSDPDQKNLIVKNIRITETEYSINSPEAVSDLKIASSSDADLTATITMTLPTKYISGTAIEAGTKITVTATGAEKVSAAGAPGESVTMTVPTAQGENYITVVAEINGATGRSSEVSIFTGMDMLSYVENLRGEISEDNMSVRLTWEPPKESLNGGYFATTGIRYNIGLIYADGEFINDPIRTEPDVTEYTLVCPEGTPQQFCRIAVVAENAAGVSHAIYYVTQIVGTPYQLPIVEEFENLVTKYSPMTASAPTSAYQNGAWSMGQPELVNPDFTGNQSTYAIIGYTDESSAKVRMRLPKVSTKSLTEAYATFELWTGHHCADPIDIYAITYGMDSPEKIATVPLGNGWQFVTVAIPAKYLDRQWMNLYIDGTLKSSEHYLIMASYSVDKSAGIDNVTEVTGSINATNGKIEISGFDGEDYAIFGIDGIVVASGICGDRTSVGVGNGIYIVKAGTHTVRVMVK